MPAIDDNSIVARIEALHEILQNEIRAGTNLSATRLDKLEAVRREDNTAMQLQIDQRFAAIQMQVDQRLENEAHARQTALMTSTSAVKAALDAAEKAVLVASVADEKRFESVNEFRRSLTDQTATFPNRNEVNIRMDGLTQQISRNTDLIAQLELRLTSRLDLISGENAGATGHRAEARLDMGTVIQVISVIFAVVAVLYAIFHH